MKIVIQYDVGGGWDYPSYTVVQCFNYESAEAFLCDLEDILKKRLDEQNEELRLENEWQKKKPVGVKFDSHVMLEWRKSAPRRNLPHDFTFCGETFEYSEFITTRSAHHKDGKVTYEIDLPEVYELNEWFAAKLINP